MTTKKMFNVLICIFILLVIIVSAFIIKLYNDPQFDFITYIAGISSLFVVILTGLYVFTTTKQLDIMDRQLTQMEKESKLKSQPFPYLKNMIIEIEAPRFFYTPPEDSYSFFSRHRVVGEINNLTNEPAICIEVFAKIIIVDKKSNKEFVGFKSRIDALPGGGNSSDNWVSIMINNDFEGVLFEALRDLNREKKICVKTKMFYKSISGGLFLQNNEYEIYSLEENTKTTMKNWHIVISMFQTKYSEELSILKSIKKSDPNNWNIIFDKIKSDVSKEIDSKPIKIFLWSKVEKSEVENISKDRYFKEIIDLSLT